MAAPTVMERPAPEVLVPAPETFAKLAALATAHPTVLTCYVRLEIQDRVATRYRIAARDALRPLHDLPSGHTDREGVHRDLERLAAFLADSRHLPHSAGMVLFACESLDLFAMMPLPRVARTRAVLDVRPRVAEAAAVAPEFAAILVAAIDRTHTRFFRVTVDEVEELTGLTMPARRGGRFHGERGDAPGWGEHDYHNRMREERHRRAAAVADRLGALLAQGSWLGIVLGGPARVTNEQVRFLPSVLQHRVLSAVHLNPTALPEQKIREVSLAARDVAHQRRTAARVEEYETALGNGWAVSGARATLRALADGQARVLLVRAGLSGNGFRCAASGRLTMAATDCRGEGEPVPVRDVVDEAIEDAMRQRVEVVVVDDLSVGGKLDGLGGVLRFRSPARAKAAPAPRSSVTC